MGMDFYDFGVGLGRRMLPAAILTRNRRGAALNYWLTPVSCVRFFEFDFVRDALPRDDGEWLDVSSPRLFALSVARDRPATSIAMANPDTNDIAFTQHARQALRLRNVTTDHADVENLWAAGNKYDCIWSISVFEHIGGNYDDSAAVRMCRDLLKPGGRLILTVPVGRAYRDEFRRDNAYGTQPANASGSYFFQRHYDLPALVDRLVRPFAGSDARFSWFGETEPGIFEAYEKKWLKHGYDVTVRDPLLMAEKFQRFASWEDMPGSGVCGIVLHA
jgi:SAM-dependent methyltransferase